MTLLPCKTMTDDELKIYRKIAVWHSRAVYLLLLMLVAIPAMFIVHWLYGIFDDIVMILAVFMFFSFAFFIPYSFCIDMQIAWTGYKPPFIFSCFDKRFTYPFSTFTLPLWPLYVLLSLPVLAHFKKVLRQIKYKDDGFSYGDFDQC